MSQPVVNFGPPKDTFYWGPSRAEPQFMADFVLAWAENFALMKSSPTWPDPPDVAALFHKGKNVWLINQAAWAQFVEATFQAYVKARDFESDHRFWKQACANTETAQQLITAQRLTILPEYALYGASAAAHRFLDRFPEHQRQEIWAKFATPRQPSFMQALDVQLASSRDPTITAKKYPWIVAGYYGLGQDPEKFFAERLKLIDEIESSQSSSPTQRQDELAQPTGLTPEELGQLQLVNQLAGFMDERKKWMMQTRHLLVGVGHELKYPEHGWLWDNGHGRELSASEVAELWKQYLDYQSSDVLLRGVVASNQGQHFLRGTVFATNTPTANPPDHSILVVPATSPTYVPLMHRAKALVTDHGGIMSHAAIVAREFGLPCIVGTKEGTKLLKTGDEIVLDLVTGEITK